MTPRMRHFQRRAAALAALGISCGACAQTTSAGLSDNVRASSSRSTASFIGIAVGKPTYGTSCGIVSGLSCNNNGTSYSITAGNMFSQNFGAELSYVDLGKADRGGGTVDARALNLGAVARLPLGQSVALEGKVGGTFGVTHVNANPLAGIETGRDSGLGLGFGVALDVSVARGFQGRVGWEQHQLHFTGQGTSNVQNVSLGVGYRF